MPGLVEALTQIPPPLSDYPAIPGDTLLATLRARIDVEPFNAIATAIFALAILHTFGATRFAALAHRIQHRHDERAKAAGRPEAELARAQEFQRKAQFYVDFVEAENSTGFHAPQEAARILGESIDFSRKGQNALRKQ